MPRSPTSWSWSKPSQPVSRVTKILSKSGDSLADVYDVEGSIAGIDELETNELGIVHEMGATVFSERFGAEIVRLATGDLSQNTAFDTTLTTPPPNIYRVLGVLVLMSTTARLTYVQVSLRDPTTGREMPIFMWEGSEDQETNLRIVENNGAAANAIALRSRFGPQPVQTLGVSDGQPRRVGEEIVFRGLTAGFGAGTVEGIALVHLGITEVAGSGLSSRGLPVPSW